MKKLGLILQEQGSVSDTELDKALSDQKKSSKRLGQYLVDTGIISEKQFISALSVQNGIDIIDIRNVTPSVEVTSIFNIKLCKKHTFVPIKINEEGLLCIAIADPLNYEVLDDISIISKRKIKVLLAEESLIRLKVEQVYSKESSLEMLKALSVDSDELVEDVEDAGFKSEPVIVFVKSMLESAISQMASDIHIEAYKKSMRVRFRVDGVLTEYANVDAGISRFIVNRIKNISNLDITEKRIPQDGRFVEHLGDSDVDFRVSIIPTVRGEKCVLRLLNKKSSLLSMKDLGLSCKDECTVNNLMSKPYGIILICGPTGSGKTTTLYTILNTLNTPDKHIVTIEDPVEYTIDGIDQVQVNTAVDLSFSSGLRSILRQDPDIIMIGEIRDKDTADIAIRSALTGHLVLSTIHTNTSVGAITRLLDMGVKPFLLASTVNGIISQRLVRKVCTKCSEEYIPSSEECDKIGIKSNNNLIVPHIVRHKGCTLCNNTGYSGRQACYEILSLDNIIVNMINDGEKEQIIQSYAVKHGMKTMKQSCIDKILSKVTTIEEITRHVSLQ